jgi:hypothetical protein
MVRVAARILMTVAKRKCHKPVSDTKQHAQEGSILLNDLASESTVSSQPFHDVF